MKCVIFDKNLHNFYLRLYEFIYFNTSSRKRVNIIWKKFVSYLKSATVVDTRDDANDAVDDDFGNLVEFKGWVRQ